MQVDHSATGFEELAGAFEGHGFGAPQGWTAVGRRDDPAALECRSEFEFVELFRHAGVLHTALHDCFQTDPVDPSLGS